MIDDLEKKLTELELGEIVEKIRAEKQWTQRAMGEALGVPYQEIQRAENAGSTQKKHWRLFVKLLPLCIDLDLIGERELLGRQGDDAKPTPRPAPQGKAKTNREQKPKEEKR